MSRNENNQHAHVDHHGNVANCGGNNQETHLQHDHHFPKPKHLRAGFGDAKDAGYLEEDGTSRGCHADELWLRSLLMVGDPAVDPH